MSGFTDSRRSDHSNFKKTKGRKRPQAAIRQLAGGSPVPEQHLLFFDGCDD